MGVSFRIGSPFGTWQYYTGALHTSTLALYFLLFFSAINSYFFRFSVWGAHKCHLEMLLTEKYCSHSWPFSLYLFLQQQSPIEHYYSRTVSHLSRWGEAVSKLENRRIMTLLPLDLWLDLIRRSSLLHHPCYAALLYGDNCKWLGNKLKTWRGSPPLVAANTIKWQGSVIWNEVTDNLNR